ncbi:MAG: hypothetical protein U1F48_10545 [Burkholderiales bacterium]
MAPASRVAAGAAVAPRSLLRRLRDVRRRFGAECEREKRALLRALAGTRLDRAADVAALHEDLLFLVAFAGSRAVERAALAQLRSIESRVRSLPRAERIRLDDSGIAGSTTRHVFPYPVARWLARERDVAAEIDWPALADAAMLDPLVGARLTDTEREGFDSGDYATRAFIALAQPRTVTSTLRWLVDVPASEMSLTAVAWDAAEVPVAWPQSAGRWSVTRNRVAGVASALRTALRRPPNDIAQAILAPLPTVEYLPRRRALRVIATARAALAARCREVNAITSPNPGDVCWCDLGDGLALAVIGIAPAARLTLETNTGYVLFANGVPLGYGGVTPLFRQANTGINIFDAFRGSEGAFVWTQMLRAFRTLYGTRRFVVNPYQFGAGNAEAIRSGAFWFYYRLGFRPVHADVRTLAAREAARMADAASYRSDARTLRALARGDLVLDLPDCAPDDAFDEALLPRAGALAARVLAARPVRSREHALRAVERDVVRAVGIADYAAWSDDDRRGLRRLAPLVAALRDVEGWSASERQALRAMLRAKGALREREFAQAAHAAPRFFTGLRAALASDATTTAETRIR